MYNEEIKVTLSQKTAAGAL